MKTIEEINSTQLMNIQRYLAKANKHIFVNQSDIIFKIILKGDEIYKIKFDTQLNLKDIKIWSIEQYIKIWGNNAKNVISTSLFPKIDNCISIKHFIKIREKIDIVEHYIKSNDKLNMVEIQNMLKK